MDRLGEERWKGTAEGHHSLQEGMILGVQKKVEGCLGRASWTNVYERDLEVHLAGLHGRHCIYLKMAKQGFQR